MRVNNKPFIKYNDFHIPFSNEDLFKWRMIDDHADVYKHHFGLGEGMQTLLDTGEPDKILSTARPTDAEQNATIQIHTLFMASDGKTLQEQDIGALIREAREKGVTVASLARKLNYKTTTTIEPGPGVVQPAARKGGRGSKSKASAAENDENAPPAPF